MYSAATDHGKLMTLVAGKRWGLFTVRDDDEVFTTRILNITGSHMADDFTCFFEDKVHGVRASTASTPTYNVPYRAMPTLEDWTAATAEEIQKLISSAPNKTCELHPAPMWLVKDMWGLLSPFISLLFNKSLTAGCFPAAFKEASVRPLLKKVGLDAGDQNFRPVSNLPYLSKLLERVVRARLQA